MLYTETGVEGTPAAVSHPSGRSSVGAQGAGKRRSAASVIFIIFRGQGLSLPGLHKATRRSRRALPTTDRELRLMAALAQIGLMSRPKKGYSSPAATGTLRAL